MTPPSVYHVAHVCQRHGVPMKKKGVKGPFSSCTLLRTEVSSVCVCEVWRSRGRVPVR